MLRSLPLLLVFASVALSHSPLHLPGRRTWYHARDHPVQKLFKRVPTDGSDYPEVGSSTWSAAYPASTPDPEQMPQAWKDALSAAVAAGKIPDIPPSQPDADGFPTYPSGFDPEGPEVCSATYKCRNPADIWDAPDGSIGVGFDDGPEAGTPKLLQFLSEQQETATHFLIGVNILHNPQKFLAILEQGGDLAVHTWTHPYMTTQTNEQVVAQLGWTMEIIRNSSGGRIPKFWRPAYGDYDNRVRAIATEVFGMDVIIWNHDTDDWSMATNGTTMEAISTSMNEWLTGPKSPGLIILEHELTDNTVQAFMDAFPLMKSNGWNTKSMALLVADSAYQNSDGTGDSSTVTPAGILLSPGASAGSNASNDTGSTDDTGTNSSSDSNSDDATVYTTVSRTRTSSASTSTGSAQNAATTTNSATGRELNTLALTITLLFSTILV